MRTAIYIRVSTDEQATEGYSIRAQEERLIAYCQSQDWDVTNIYKDEGYSAKDTNRPQLTHMIEDIKKEKIDVVLVYRLDRFTRSVLDLHKLLETLDQYNCKFKSATEPFDTTSATGRMFITLVAALAEWERATLVERVNFAMLKKANLGEWSGGHVPYGYDVVDGELYINEDEAPIVRRIFELMKVYSIRKTTEIIKNEGYLMRGKPFGRHNIRYISANPLYMGKVRYNESSREYMKHPSEQRLFDGKHEAIVDEDTFWKVNPKRQRFKKTESTFVFSGVLRCVRCGEKIFGTHRRVHKSGESRMYRCEGKSNKQCDLPSINEKSITKALFKNIDRYIDKLYEERQTFISDQSKRDYDKELKDVRKHMQKFKTMYVNDIISIDELNEQIEEFRIKEKELERLVNEQPESINQDFLLNFTTLWNEGNDVERKEIVKAVFEAIVIDVDESKQRNRDVIIKQIY